MTTSQRLIAGLWRLTSLPPMLAHELTHFLLALPWAEQSAIVVDDSGPFHGVDWTDDAPRAAIVLSSLGPTFVGTIAGGIGLWHLWHSPPSSARQWVLVGVSAIWWSIYAAPSPADADIHGGKTD